MPFIRLALIHAIAAIPLAASAGPAQATGVGLAAVDIEPPLGAPLAGYGARARRLPGFVDWGNKHPYATWFRPSEGRHTPVRSKAMVVQHADGRLVFVSLDLVGVERRMVRDLARRLRHLGVSEEELVVGATHTHSGPGAISRRLSLSLVAVDRFNRDVYEHVMGRIVASVEQAFASIRTAELLTVAFETEGLQRNKWRRKGEQHFDRRARFLLARSTDDGRLMGGLLNFALHGNGMPLDDLRFSADTPGSIATNVEELIAIHNGTNTREPVVLFFNGAEGDVGNTERSVEAVARHGREFAAQAADARVLDSLRPVGADLVVRRRSVWLGLPGMSLRNCTGKVKPRRDNVPDFRLPLPFMQQHAWITLISIGELSMLTWPGEASAQVGYDTQALAAKLGEPDLWILGLTNDYQSYFTTRAEYYEGRYDACSSLFRWKGADRILKGMETMLIEGGA